MSVAESRKKRNIESSLLRFVNTNFSVPNSLTNNVNLRDRTFDVSKMDYWVYIDFLNDGAGKKSFTLVQFTIFSRVGGRQSGGDRYGDKLSELAELLHNAMHVDSIQIYDYSTKTSPTVIANAKIIVRNSNGKMREPDESTELEPDANGVLSIAITYRLEHIGDLSRAVAYYD